MLRQHNFQISKPKRRKLYTPLSDEEEDLEIENTPIKDPEKVESKNVEKGAVKSTKKPNSLGEITVKELDPDEIADNLSWDMIKPMLRKDAVLLKSIWEHYLRFNTREKANKMVLHKLKPEKIEVNFNQIMDVLMTSSTNINGHSSKQQINESLVNIEKEQEKSGHSSKNQFNSVVKVRQPVNGFSIKAIPSAINCGALSSIFTQHEISKENQNIKQINRSIKDDFIGSQFINTRILNVEHETITSDSVNRTKPLIDPNQILNEWLRNSPPKRMQHAASDEDIPKTSLLSKSGKKIYHKESLSKCFL